MRDTPSSHEDGNGRCRVARIIAILFTQKKPLPTFQSIYSSRSIMFYSHNPFTPIETVFRISKYASAYPTTRWTRCISLFTICLCGGFVVYGILSDVINFTSTTLIQTILEVLDIIEDSILFVVLCFGFYAYQKHDMAEIFRSVYLGHDAILKLGLVPSYRKHWSTVLAFSVIIEVFSEYCDTYFENAGFTWDETLTDSFGGIMPRIVTHLYICQFYALMELVQDQMTAVVQGMIYHNHWYLESMTNVQSQLLKTARTVFEMYQKVISIIIVHSTVCMMITAYDVAKMNNRLKVGILVFELIAVISILHACDHTKSKVKVWI